MMLAANFLKAVAHRRQEIGVCRDDRAIDIKLDYRLAPIDCGHLALVPGCACAKAKPTGHSAPLISLDRTTHETAIPVSDY